MPKAAGHQTNMEATKNLPQTWCMGLGFRVEDIENPTWKPERAPVQTAVVLKEAYVAFHVNLEEGTLENLNPKPNNLAP